MKLLSIFLIAGSLAAQNNYLVHNLVSDLPGQADTVDPKLVNPWGNGFGQSPFWIGNNGSGTSTLYNGFGTANALIVNMPSAGGALSGGTVTGVIFSGGAGFNVVAGSPASFMFCNEDGVISGWNATLDSTHAHIMLDNSASGAVYKGCALGSTVKGPALYAANFNSGNIDVFDVNLKPIPSFAFANSAIPAGFAPFNIQALGGNLYVTYAKQNAAKHDDVAGAGNGYVAEFDMVGNLVANLAAQGPLNSPWGLAISPANFGAFPNALLVGNSGDGNINAFNPVTGASLGALTMVDATGKPVAYPGLWSISFGSGAQSEDTGTLYFTAGIGGGPNNDPVESHGLLGSIQPAPSFKPAGIVNSASLLPGPISANEWVSIFGNALSPITSTAQITGATLPGALKNVGVTVNGEQAFVLFIGNTQLSFLVPSDIQLGTAAQIVVTDNGLASASVTAPVVPEAPAFFIIGAANGNNYIAAEHADGSLIAPANLIKNVTSTGAKAGETIVLYANGFGPTNPPVPNGQVVTGPLPLAILPTVVIEGIPGKVTFAGVVTPGLYQINVTVPATLPPGDAAVIATLANGETQPGAFITISQ
jgi:uncharacterized protein (TIGR03118 family)